MMRWSEVEKKYGKRLAKKMKKHLTGITVSSYPNGETNFPERDIELAYKEATGKKVHEYEWD